MNKNETIISVIEAFDEAARLEAENRELRRRADAINSGINTGESETPRWFGAIYEYGRREIFKKYTPYWTNVEVYEDEDGNRTAEKYVKWFKRNFKDFPDFMSREDFMCEFEAEAKALYDEKLAEALRG